MVFSGEGYIYLMYQLDTFAVEGFPEPLASSEHGRTHSCMKPDYIDYITTLLPRSLSSSFGP